MEPTIKNYQNDDITVVWKPDMCIHSTLCWRGLLSVFNPKARPWINMSGGETEAIKAQVENCPSGALSYYMNEPNADAADKQVQVDTTVEVMKNGPLMVYGNISIKDAKGNTETKHKVTAFCRCGASANKPYCDGSHVKVGFRDE